MFAAAGQVSMYVPFVSERWLTDDGLVVGEGEKDDRESQPADSDNIDNESLVPRHVKHAFVHVSSTSHKIGQDRNKVCAVVDGNS
jgi:hypothetical protein